MGAVGITLVFHEMVLPPAHRFAMTREKCDGPGYGEEARESRVPRARGNARDDLREETRRADDPTAEADHDGVYPRGDRIAARGKPVSQPPLSFDGAGLDIDNARAVAARVDDQLV